MKKLWIIALILLFLVTSTLIFFYLKIASKGTYFTQDGEVYKDFTHSVFIEPFGYGKPFWARPEDASNYPVGEYEVFDIPSQKQLSYVTGTFQGWEDIDSSKDKYLLLKNPKTKQIKKYRVSFESSELFRDGATTTLSYEKLSLNLKGENKIINPSDNNFIVSGFEVVSSKLKLGDSLALKPVFDPPFLQKADEQGVYLISQVYIKKWFASNL